MTRKKKPVVVKREREFTVTIPELQEKIALLRLEIHQMIRRRDNAAAIKSRRGDVVALEGQLATLKAAKAAALKELQTAGMHCRNNIRG